MSNTISSGNDMSFLFGSSSSGKTNGLYDSLGDYASLKNGSAARLYKAYYKKEEENSKEAKNSISTTEKNAYTTVKSAAEGLSEAVDKLGSKSLYEKEDREDLYSAVKDFIDNYNSVVKNGTSETLESLNSITVRMLKNTKANSNALNQVGISVGKDGSLSIDKDKFKQADISTVKALFNGSGSFADSTASRAGIVKNTVANKLSVSKVYNAEGKSEQPENSSSSSYSAIV